MSKKEKETEQSQTVGRKMTKYDLKMQKREEEKKKEAKEKKISTIVSVVVLVALVCLVASFPIRTYMTVHEDYVAINGEAISRVEFDYNYNVVKNNYMNQYGSYLSYFGLNASADLSTQMYSDTLTWKDYFEQQTVDSIIRVKALKAQADAAGFTCDTDAEYKNFVQDVKDAAEKAGSSVKSYLQQVYGTYATMGRIENIVKESIYVNAYYDKVSEEKAPSDEELQAYYNDNKNEFDSVDYYQTVIKAELPTEPTDLADPVDDTEATDENTEDTVYKPSDAEVAKAMEDAKVLADEAVDAVTKDGELKEGAKYNGTTNVIRDWLYDESRAEGDTTVLEDTNSNQYYVLSFVKRYLDETPSADVHIIAQQNGDGQAILDEWKNGEATEESFAALADQYNDGTSFTAAGGLYEGVSASGTLEVMADWLFDEGRNAGDTTVVSDDEGNAYVMYYVGQNDPEWKINAKSEVLASTMDTYLSDISADFKVEDPKKHLNYLLVEAATESTEATDTAEDTTATDSTAATEEVTTENTEDTTEDTTATEDSVATEETN